MSAGVYSTAPELTLPGVDGAADMPWPAMLEHVLAEHDLHWPILLHDDDSIAVAVDKLCRPPGYGRFHPRGPPKTSMDHPTRSLTKCGVVLMNSLDARGTTAINQIRTSTGGRLSQAESTTGSSQRMVPTEGCHLEPNSQSDRAGDRTR